MDEEKEGIELNVNVEIWKRIRIHTDYKISNLGRIKSFKRNKERILKLRKDKKGYLYIILSKQGKIKLFKTHRLVLNAFKPIDNPELYQCNHIDGNKQNNYINNLEWCTGSENIKHAFKIGLTNKKGEKHPNHKLTEKEVIEIKKLLLERKQTQKEISLLFKVSKPTISDINRGHTWKHLI